MARRFFGERQHRDRFGFRWRGAEISRIEALSDAVFAFSVTLLIVTLDIPKTFAELLETMKGFLAFAASFAILLWIWHIHYLYFRRYGLQDAFVKTMNGFLLFVVLFYVYPLKFVFSNVIHFFYGGQNSIRLASGEIVSIIREGDPTAMMIVYAVGFIAVFLCYAILYWHAHRKREELRLSELENYVTRIFMRQYLLCVGVGLLSLALVVFGGDDFARFSGYSYALLGPVLAIHGFITGSKVERLKLQLGQAQQQNQQQRQQQGQQQIQQQRRHEVQRQQQRPHQQQHRQRQQRPGPPGQPPQEPRRG